MAPKESVHSKFIHNVQNWKSYHSTNKRIINKANDGLLLSNKRGEFTDTDNNILYGSNFMIFYNRRN
jgi:hypothetical protein